MLTWCYQLLRSTVSIVCIACKIDVRYVEFKNEPRGLERMSLVSTGLAKIVNLGALSTRQNLTVVTFAKAALSREICMFHLLYM